MNRKSTKLSAVPPIRYINLERDTERRDRMQGELARLRLPGERFPAVLWSALSSEEQNALYSEEVNARQFHKPLVAGEKGCYASHLLLWQWLLESSHDAVVVLEDDVQLCDDFERVCSEIAAVSVPPWDMVKLIGRIGLGKAEKQLTAVPLCAGYKLHGYRRVPSLTAGYVISRTGASKLLAHRKPFGRPIDVDLRHWWETDRLQILGLCPSVIELDATSLTSSIGVKVIEDRGRTKWRKFRNKLKYTLCNTWHRL